MFFAGSWPINSTFVEQVFIALDCIAPLLGITPMGKDEITIESNKIILWFYETLSPTVPAVAYAFYFGL